jgi:glycosyltransferase involved in cell wall biosynthesis
VSYRALRLRLVVPADVDLPTGGNAYDLALAAALRADGDEVALVRCDPDDLAGALRQPWNGPTLVDGLLACSQPGVVAASGAGVLVHMPLALETGLARGRAAELDRREGLALRAARWVVTTSHWCAQYVAEHHRVARVAVATPGVEPAPISEGSDPPLLVHVAALLPNKDQLGVVAALAQLSDLPWRARLAGPTDRDPVYALKVQRAVRDAGLSERVRVTGTIARDAAWAGADLALLPSHVESFGMVVTEALARGVPVVASEGGAVEALGATASGEVPGAVVPPGSPEALASVLRRWLTDGTYRDRVRRAALERRATLDRWDVTAQKVRSALTGG